MSRTPLPPAPRKVHLWCIFSALPAMNGPLLAELKFRENTVNPGAALKYFNDGGVQRIFLGVTFWPKGIFLGRENNREIFWVLYFSSAQIKNNMSAIYSFVFEQNQS